MKGGNYFLKESLETLRVDASVRYVGIHKYNLSIVMFLSTQMACKLDLVYLLF